MWFKVCGSLINDKIKMSWSRNFYKYLSQCSNVCGDNRLGIRINHFKGHEFKAPLCHSLIVTSTTLGNHVRNPFYLGSASNRLGNPLYYL